MALYVQRDNMHRAMIFAAATAALATNAHAFYPTSGEYDENDTQPNRVDRDASGSISAQRFGARVEEAYLRDFGGVLDGTILGASPDYGVSQNKDLLFLNTNLGIGQPNTEATPISGTGSFAFSNTSRSGGFTFTLNGGQVLGEQVLEAGFTALSSSITGYPTINATATLDDGSTLAATSSISPGAGAEDTFFGFSAPAGRYITGIDVDYQTTNSVVRLWVDDIGFKTGLVTDSIYEAAAAVDARAELVNGSFIVTDGDTSILSQEVDFANIDRRGIVEFALPDEAGPVDVTEAILEIDVGSFTFSGTDFPLLELFGYAGDGDATVADATASTNLIGQRRVDDTDVLAISLDADYVESLINSGEGFLGLLFRSERQVAFSSTEAAAFADVVPTLTLRYSAVPEPTSIGLIALAGLPLLTRRRRA